VKLLAFFVALIASFPVQAAVTPNVADIVSRMQTMNLARNAALHKYRSVRTYEVSYKGFPSDREAKMVVRMDFTAPATKTFTVVSEEGSKLLLNKVIRKALESEQEAATEEYRAKSAMNEANYEFTLVGQDTVDGRPTYILQVKPRKSEKYLYDGRVWVDAADYAIARIEAKPAKNPSFWISSANIQHRNQKVGDFWFPAANRSTSHVRMGGNAQLSIDYGDFEILQAERLDTTKQAVQAGP
jgi:outer membrane lipoprotein-sorting protein